ncbi:MAG: hydantoinase/oxoprolinase family protein, partial [Actinomycetota bacterium]
SDPRGAHLVAFGGAGGLHATSLARSLGMAGVVIPPFGGVFSAVGLLLAPPRSDGARAVLVLDADFTELVGQSSELEAEIRDALGRAGFAEIDVSFSVDVRYLGQAHEINVAWDRSEGLVDVRKRFDRAHRAKNGFERPDDAVEIVAVRGVGLADPALTIEDVVHWVPSAERSDTRREVVSDIGPVSSLVVDRAALRAGDILEGPAIIEETEATTYLAPGETAEVHMSGAIEVTW